jgi:hypothetical protein
MMIKDLEMHKDLTSDELSAVRGGDNFNIQGGQFAPASALAGGLSVNSPQTVNNNAVNAPTSVQNDNDLFLSLKSELASVNGSAFTGIVQL